MRSTLLRDRTGLRDRVSRFFALDAAASPTRHECPRGCFTEESVGTDSTQTRFLTVGHVGAGKSTFIASLAVAGAHTPDWYSFHLADEAWDRFRDFSHAGDIILPTARLQSHEPLVRLDGGTRPTEEDFGNYGIYPVALGDALRGAVVMDMPGEGFVPNFTSLLNHAPSVQDAPMLILCVDPSHAGSAAETAGPLLRVAQLREYGGHLAVVGTKSDLHYGRAGFPAELAQNLPTDMSPTQYHRTLEDHSGLARDFLRTRGFGNVLRIAENFESSSFHLVSATSCSPHDGVYPHIDPVRVLDPFIQFDLQHRGAHAV